jgi:hypothetical protein
MSSAARIAATAGSLTTRAATAIAPSARARRRRIGSPPARPICRRSATSTRSLPCRPRSRRPPTRTRRWSTTSCSAPRPRRCSADARTAGRAAPIPAVPLTTIGGLKSTRSRRSLRATATTTVGLARMGISFCPGFRQIEDLATPRAVAVLFSENCTVRSRPPVQSTRKGKNHLRRLARVEWSRPECAAAEPSLSSPRRAHCAG